MEWRNLLSLAAGRTFAILRLPQPPHICTSPPTPATLPVMKVAIQGERGSFSHEAAERMLPGCMVVPCARSAEVFDRVQRGSVAAAVIPIENSLAGTVAEHADLLLAHDVFIQGEFLLRIVHNLIAAPGVKLNALRKVLSHPVALDQCRDFFRHHPRIEPVPFYDTAGSVKHVVAHRLPEAAGIASRHAAREYSGKILQAGIEDDKRNFTRFFLIRKIDRKTINPTSEGKRSVAPLPAPNPARRQQDVHRLQSEETSLELCSNRSASSPCATSASAKSSPAPCADVLGNTSST